MRNFALRDENDNEIVVFTGKAPRQAALEPTNRDHTDIKLPRAGHEEAARIHRREDAGGQS